MTDPTLKMNVQRKQSPLQVGIDRLRSANVLEECKDRVDKMATIIKADPSLAFDVLYLDIPWKHVTPEYLKSLPLKDLVVKDQVSGLLLWVDSCNLLEAFKLIRAAWGFTFHSVIHIVSYENNTVTTTPATSQADTTTADGATTTQAKQPTKKAAVPHGWQTNGIIPSRSRQLLFAYAGSGTEDNNFTRIFKDVSFIRKRLGQVSNFVYPEPTNDGTSTGLSSKKKNVENWVVYPNYDVYNPSHLRGVFETFVKPSTRVLSMFTNGLSKTWYSWGPNVPGYVNGPLRPDSGFGLLCALQKYFSCMKTVTVNKYLTLVNLYIIQMAKQEGLAATQANDGDGSGEPCIGALVLQRFGDFLSDLQRKAESAGGVKDGPLGNLSLVQLCNLTSFTELECVARAQFLVQVAQVIKHTFRKMSEAASHRKKVVKRKREDTTEEGEAKSSKTTSTRKYGIAAPVDISPELAAFMELPAGTPVARTTVVKFINKYIVDNSLQNPDHKSEIMVQSDEKLLKLLNPDPNFGTVTYFNLCKLLGPHFVRDKGTVTVAA